MQLTTQLNQALTLTSDICTILQATDVRPCHHTYVYIAFSINEVVDFVQRCPSRLTTSPTTLKIGMARCVDLSDPPASIISHCQLLDGACCGVAACTVRC